MFSFLKRPMINAQGQKQVAEAIKEAESKTSGEVRVYMEHKCEGGDPLARAKLVFAKLQMEKTEARNAVLIYIASGDKKFALFGDTAIYEKAGGPVFWEKAAAMLTGHLKKNEIAEGLCNCIRMLGAALAEQFPADPSIKKNELPDEIVFGK